MKSVDNWKLIFVVSFVLSLYSQIQIMNSTLSDWNTKVHQYFDRSHPSVISSFNNINIHNILVIIGSITVCLLICLLMMQCALKIRDIYRTVELKEPCRKSRKLKSKYPSYQQLLDTDSNQCKCFQYSCLPKFQCVKPTYQILNQLSYYEQIDERSISSSISRVHVPSHHSSVCVHTVK